MKKFILLIALSLFSLISLQINAQKPEKVVSIVRAVKDYEWYKTQSQAWKKVLEKEPKNEEAWIYYYTATRMARLANYQEWQKLQNKDFEPLEQIIENAEKQIPNTFTINYLKVYNYSSFSEKGNEALENCKKTDPNSLRILPDLVTQAIVNFDEKNLTTLCTRWYESNEMPSELLSFNYNLLMSVEKDAILFVQGDNDTYPCYVLQYGLNIRKDVLVINASLIQTEEHQKEICKKLNIKPMKADSSTLFDEAKILQYITKNHGNRPVYFACTMDTKYYKNMQDSTYMVGLTFKYSTEDFDNVAIMRKNFEQIYQLDYLKNTFSFHTSSSVVDQINSCYIPMFIKLYEHYKNSGDKEKAEKVKSLAMILSQRMKYEQFLEYFN